MKILRLIFRKIKRNWVDHHENRAICYFYSSTANGDRHSQFQLARLYERGTKTIEKNLVYAYVLYYIAAKKGIKQASHCLEVLSDQMPMMQWQEAQNLISRLDKSEITPPSSLLKRLKAFKSRIKNFLAFGKK